MPLLFTLCKKLQINFLVFFCHLLINVANILEPDQARQNVGPDLDLNCLHPDGIPKCFLKKLFFKKSADEKNHEKY